MTTPIEVRISAGELNKCRAAWHAEMMMLAKCKDAGMPLMGTLKYKGLAHGIFEKFEDWDTQEIVFRWRDKK